MNDARFEVVLNGGLGNQLFGWALGFAASQESGLDCRLNCSRIEGREFQLGAFNIVGESVAPFQGTYLQNRYFHRLAKKFPKVFLKNSFIESGFHFQENFLSPKKLVSYYGYFQSYKYFDKYSFQIREKLNEFQSNSKRFNMSSEYIFENKPYAVHIRRGDYLGREDFHGLASEEYFQMAIQLIKTSDPSATFILFSDSPLLTKDLLPDVNYMPEVTDSHSPAETLMLMSQCKGIIGSNSSFSWWAAYVMESNAIRIFPKPWFVNRTLDTRDLLPPNWIQLDNSGNSESTS